MAMEPYQILGLDRNASKDEVKRAYRKLARQYHPDLHPNDPQAAQKMNEINEAYDRIMNPDKYAAEDARKARASGQYNPNSNRGPGHSGYGGAGQGGQYGWSGDFGFGFDDFFDMGATSTNINPEPSATDPAIIIQAINAINAGKAKEATQLLYRVPSTDRNARWYYVIAIANHKLGNTMLATDQINKACEMDPTNNDYITAAKVINSSGRTYTQTTRSKGFNMGFMDPTTLCCICLGINMCLGGGGFGLCRGFYF